MSRRVGDQIAGPQELGRARAAAVTEAGGGGQICAHAGEPGWRRHGGRRGHVPVALWRRSLC
jgi:hypothetical protein